MKHHLIGLPHGGDFDLLAAARLLLIQDNRSFLLMPKRVASNAWEYAKRQEWFRPIFLQKVNWELIEKVSLLGVSVQQNNPELISVLSGKNLPVVCYSQVPPRFPFPVEHEQYNSQSITSFLLKMNFKSIIGFSQDDLALFLIAITEKTWAGLSSKSTEIDNEILFNLRKKGVPGKVVANNILLPFREGLKGLLKDILFCTEDLEIKGRSVMMSIVKSPGNIQDVYPVLEAVWARQDPSFMIVAIAGTSKTRVWARTRISKFDLNRVFQNQSISFQTEWLTFIISEIEISEIREKLLSELQSGIQGDLLASSIMTASPISVEISTNVETTLETMLRYHLMGLVVTEGGKYVGTITRRDLDRAIQMKVMDSDIRPFVPVEHPFVGPETSLGLIRNIMINGNISRIPVVEDDKPIGIITARDVLRHTEDPYPHQSHFQAATKNFDHPDSLFVERLFRKTAPISLLSLLKQIGEIAKTCGLKAFLVGGYVRDLFLELPNSDLDVVLTGDALVFASKLQAEMKAEIKLYERFGTACLKFGSQKIDFSSARIEHYSEVGALPLVVKSGIANDLARRDFTINAMAISLDPENFFSFFDYFGGLTDLNNKKIRVLHALSFFEDPTRIFRAIRFSTRFHFDFSDDTRKALDLALSRQVVAALSKKRIAAEILRCFNEQMSVRIFERLFYSGLIKFLHPELKKFSELPERFGLLRGIIRRFSVIGEKINSEAVNWVGLLSPLQVDEADKTMKEAGIDSQVRKIAAFCIFSLGTIPGLLSKTNFVDDWGLFKLLSPLSLEAIISLVAFSLDKGESRKVFKFLEKLRNIKPLIGGHELVDIGFEEGPRIRDVLGEIKREKVLGNLLTREQELDYARRKCTNL
ncbi:MAG: CBS domain-containing protein [Candidatus Riflebacteria bacterium]|nr:CBS domain-containing protein [Candidatus Riflebacteria bacterium]